MHFQVFNKHSRRPLLWIAASLILSLFLGCAHEQTQGDDAEALFREAEEALKDERYLIALEKFREVKNRFPYSARATESELRIADAYFDQESYIEAESAYSIFKELHPTHPKIDYVSFRIALSYFNQIPSNTARDLTAAYKAIDSFESVIRLYSSSEYALKAKDYIVQVRGKLAEYERYVADFYFQREHYLSATYRYSALLKDFGDLGFGEEALFRLGYSYRGIHMFSNAKEALNRLLKQYPETSYKEDAIALLKNIDEKK